MINAPPELLQIPPIIDAPIHEDPISEWGALSNFFNSLKWKTLSIDPVSGEKHLRHQMTKDGFYKGRLIKDLRKPIKEESEEVTS